MKLRKILSLIMVTALILLLVGCSSNEKTEEELKAEIRAELEAEERLKEELKAELEAEMKDEAAESEINSSSDNLLSENVESTEAVVDNDLAAIGTNKLKIMTTTLNVRSDKTTDSEVIGKVYLDENYEILEIDQGYSDYQWTKIKIDEGTSGWVAGAFTKSLSEVVPVSESPDFEIPSDGQVEISLGMTKSELIRAIGEEYTLNTIEDNAYYTYYSTLVYDNISFVFYHDEPLSENTAFNSVTIKSNEYTIKGIDFKLGDPVVDGVKFCEENYSNFENVHGFELTIIPDIWVYRDEDLALALSLNGGYLNHETGEFIDNSNLLYIDSIRLFTMLD